MHKEKPFIESATIFNRPISEPVRAISGFSDGLACMDNMLRDEHIPPTIIASKIIPDSSGGKASVSAKEMIFTSLSQMSRTSLVFRIVDMEVDPLKQDTVQTLTNALLPSGQMTVPMPALYISGSITYVDQNVLLKNSGVGISSKDYEVGYSKDIIVTAVGMDLHIGDFSSRTLLPGIDSSNEITAGNKGIGFDAGAEIKKAGIQFELGGTTSQGVGPAIRTLVDLGMIELVGKWARVPYWQCLSLDQAHPEFQRQLYKWYTEMSDGEKIRLFQTGLRSLGYYNGAINGQMSGELKTALHTFQADYKAVPSGNINFESYERLMKNYVVADGNGKFLRIGWKHDSESERFTQAPRDGLPPWGKAEPKPIEIKITLDRKDPQFYQGEALQLFVTTDRMSYLNCFYQDAQGSVAKIYPSMFQPPAQLQANMTTLIPDANNPNSFSIEMTSIGNEAVACVASINDISAELENMGIADLEAIEDITTVEQIVQYLQENMKDQIQGVNTIQWVIN